MKVIAKAVIHRLDALLASGVDLNVLRTAVRTRSDEDPDTQWEVWCHLTEVPDRQCLVIGPTPGTVPLNTGPFIAYVVDRRPAGSSRQDFGTIEEAMLHLAQASTGGSAMVTVPAGLDA